MRYLRWIQPIVLTLIGVTACGEGGAGPGDPAPASAAVEVGNDFFQSGTNGSTDPSVDTVAVNGNVTWTWTEVGDHGVAFDDPGIVPSDILFEAGSQHSVSFSAPGTYTYSCSVHRLLMRGAVVVR